MSDQKPKTTWKSKLHEIIYEADTPAGKLFDVVLLIVILLSIVLVMLESVDYIGSTYFSILNSLEWIITILFTLEYIARIVFKCFYKLFGQKPHTTCYEYCFVFQIWIYNIHQNINCDRLRISIF